MNAQELIATARTLIAGEKGLLAMDESNPTCRSQARTRDGSISTRSAGFGGALSADGSVVTLTDFANDLVPSDTNNESDVFVRGPLQP
jgi:hypothetical protein